MYLHYDKASRSVYINFLEGRQVVWKWGWGICSIGTFFLGRGHFLWQLLGYGFLSVNFLGEGAFFAGIFYWQLKGAVLEAVCRGP